MFSPKITTRCLILVAVVSCAAGSGRPLVPPSGVVPGAPAAPGAPTAPESEAMLLAREAAAGNGVATGRLLRMLTPRLGSVVRAIMGAGHPARDDALQLTLIGFVQALAAFRGECDPAGYAA